jgi:hypothetical protein
VQRTPDLFGQSKLCFGAYSRPGAGPRSQFFPGTSPTQDDSPAGVKGESGSPPPACYFRPVTARESRLLGFVGQPRTAMTASGEPARRSGHCGAAPGGLRGCVAPDRGRPSSSTANATLSPSPVRSTRLISSAR